MHKGYVGIRGVSMEMAKKTCVIGLCGRSGAGKGFVSALFAELGISAVDTDKVYAEMTGPADRYALSDCMKELVAEFGESILSVDGALNRRAMSAIVFSEGGDAARLKLNEIAHRHILAETDRRVQACGARGDFAVIVDAPLLFESGYNKRCDFVIAAVAPDHVLVDRIVSRDRISADEAKRRLASQAAERIFRERADFVVETNTDRESLRSRVEEIYLSIKERVKGEGNEA